MFIYNQTVSKKQNEDEKDDCLFFGLFRPECSLSLDGLRIYIAGDTEDIPEMQDIKVIDIAFLPCNQPYTMTPEQLIKAAKAVKPKVLFPYHYGKTDVCRIPEQLKDGGIEVRIRHYEQTF